MLYCTIPFCHVLSDDVEAKAFKVANFRRSRSWKRYKSTASTFAIRIECKQLKCLMKSEGLQKATCRMKFILLYNNSVVKVAEL